MTILGAHPTRLDLCIHPGDPIDVRVPVLDGAGATPNTWPTGWTAAAIATSPDGQLLWSFTPTFTSTAVEIAATPAETGTWAWTGYAARLVATVTPPGGAASEIAVGWIRLYRP